MKLLVLASGSSIFYDDLDSCGHGTDNLGIAYGWNGVKRLIKKDLRNDFTNYYSGGRKEWKNEDGDADEYDSDKERLRNMLKEIDSKDFIEKYIRPSDMEKLTNPKYIYPMVGVLEYDVVNNASEVDNIIYYVVAVK